MEKNYIVHPGKTRMAVATIVLSAVAGFVLALLIKIKLVPGSRNFRPYFIVCVGGLSFAGLIISRQFRKDKFAITIGQSVCRITEVDRAGNVLSTKEYHLDDIGTLVYKDNPRRASLQLRDRAGHIVFDGTVMGIQGADELNNMSHLQRALRAALNIPESENGKYNFRTGKRVIRL